MLPYTAIDRVSIGMVKGGKPSVPKKYLHTHNSMSNKFVIACLGSLLTGILSTPALAETVLERIERTGTLTAGTRADAMPLAYTNEKGEWVGYSIDLLELVRAQLEQELSKDIELNLVEVGTSDRISKVENENVDIICGATTYTSSRARRVDFSVGFFRTGTQFLVRREEDLELGLFRVGIIAGTTNAELVERYLRIARFITIPDRATGLVALNADRIDALASDGILLEGLRQTTHNPDAYEIIPRLPINPETYACILPKNNLDFLQIVNRSLLDFMQGVIEQDGQAMDIMNTWFGTDGVVPINQEPLISFFQGIVSFYSSRSQR